MITQQEDAPSQELQIDCILNEQPDKATSVHSERKAPVEVKELTCMERATLLVDGTADSIYFDILDGHQKMHRRKPMPSPEPHDTDRKKKSIMVEKPVDIDQHKKLIRKFMRMNKKMQKVRQQRSISTIEHKRKQEEQQEKRRIEERNKTLEARRGSISERLKQKQQMMNEIRKSVLETTRKYNSVKNTKFLYQQKQQIFTKNFILPKLEQEKRVLQKIKEERQPLDITVLRQHEKRYQQKLKSDKINRSLTSRVLQIENHYDPPKFVSKAFQIMEAEQSIKKEEEKIKEQQKQVNEYRKKQFLKVIEERQKHQFEKIKQKSIDKSLEKSQSGGSISVIGTIPGKQKRKAKKVSRQDRKKQGDSYLHDIIERNKAKRKKSPRLLEVRTQTQIASDKIIPEKPKPKTQYEIQMIEEKRVQRFQKLRVKVVDDIVKDQHIDKHFKLQKLSYENSKIDRLLSDHKELHKHGKDEAAALYLSSIHTKLAILEVSSPRAQEDDDEDD